jgi:glycosyltransferase involved in cell wall biosynthesis
MNSTITVIIPVYGPGPHLEEVVAALEAQLDDSNRIIISHSGNSDPTERFTNNQRVTVLHSKERLFAGAARNRGLALAETDWVAFIDEDVVPGPDWYAALAACIDADEADCIIGAIGYRTSGGYWGIALWFVEFGSVHPYKPKRKLTGGPSANMAVRKSRFIETGAFPEDWRSSEELVAEARMVLDGRTIIFEPDVLGLHFNQSGAGRVLGHAYLYGRFGARLRRAFTFLPGAATIRYPILSTGMWLARLAQITTRVMTRANSPKVQFLLHLPAITACLIAWNISFTREAFRPNISANQY